MTNQEIEQLVERYIDGTASDAERRLLLEWYRGNLEKDTLWLSENKDERRDVKDRMKAQIRASIRKSSLTDRPKIGRLRKFAPIAAAVLFLISTSVWIGYKMEIVYRSQQQLYVSHEDAVDSIENRYVQLPDSSVVILRQGSTLEVVTDFTEDSREVRLVGEGYFDIKRDESRPFIVHTKDVKTVVLGTAFTIKAHNNGKDDVEVTVQRGKVRVERADQQLADLLPNERLLITESSLIQKKQEIGVEEDMQWASDDLRFEGMTFEALAQRLERRYDVKIHFANKALRNCRLNGTFDGTENLIEILKVLCATNSSTFTMSGRSYQIHGVGCDDSGGI